MRGPCLAIATVSGRSRGLHYLVTVVLDQLEHKASVHERQQVVEEERQADVHLLGLLQLLSMTRFESDG